jgi:hypothetical protein
MNIVSKHLARAVQSAIPVGRHSARKMKNVTLHVSMDLWLIVSVAVIYADVRSEYQKLQPQHQQQLKPRRTMTQVEQFRSIFTSIQPMLPQEIFFWDLP